MQAKLLGELRFTAEVNILLRCALQAPLVGARKREKAKAKQKKKKRQNKKEYRKNEASKYRMGQQKSQKSFAVLQVQMSVCPVLDPSSPSPAAGWLWVLRVCVLVCVTIFYSFMHFGNKNFIFCLTK